MRRSRGRVVDVGSTEQLRRRLRDGARTMRGWRVQGLDLTEVGGALLGLDAADATFLGCTFAPGDAERLEQRGALVLPAIATTPLDVYRGDLYSPDELYDTADYRRSLDARAYSWSQRPRSTQDSLAVALHDHAIDEALATWVAPRRVVGVMGGHAAQRGEPGYAEAARLGHALAAHATVATGGGPGAMEAANLGAALADHDDDGLGAAVSRLVEVPSFRPSVGAWARAARAVRDETVRAGGLRESLGVPTWHYGHEPPNLFATAIAKFVGNPAREALLLEICDAGIVFLPGAAGTVQEVFQDACENYYADGTAVAPMVLVGHDFWTRTLPAWPLLQALARGRAMERHVHLVDTVDQAAEIIAL